MGCVEEVFFRRMSDSDTTVRWEILKGLPGEGPPPRYFHLGHPTPWKEGLAVRFWKDGGDHWIGNFQSGDRGNTQVVSWPEANSVYVIAAGGLYIYSADDPESYTTLGIQSHVEGAILSDDRTTLFVLEDYGISA